jgi:hypothetical protein
MRPIPINLRNEMENDPFYKQCCMPEDGLCEGRVEWHHNLIYAGSQLNEKWAILPLCQYHHNNEKHRMIKEQINWIMLNRATDDQLRQYSKAVDYIRERDRLNNLYGKRE